MDLAWVNLTLTLWFQGTPSTLLPPEEKEQLAHCLDLSAVLDDSDVQMPALDRILEDAQRAQTA